MANLLHINSSVRHDGSLSRLLGDEYVAEWIAANPSGSVVSRDLAVNPVPHLTEPVIGAFFTPAEHRSAEQLAAISTSETLVDELLLADTIVIGAPMYNLSIPSGLKAWIDHVGRAGRTFTYSPVGPEGLVTGKKVVVIVATGGTFSEGPAAAYDHVTTYLRSVLGFLGMTDVTFIIAEGVAMGEAAIDVALTKGRAQIAGGV